MISNNKPKTPVLYDITKRIGTKTNQMRY